jgi:hypothetical protein
LIGIVASAFKAGEEASVAVSVVAEGEGLAPLGLGVEDSVADGSSLEVSVAVGVGTLRFESEESLQPKKLARMNTVPTTPTIRFVLLSDFKLHCLNDTI